MSLDENLFKSTFNIASVNIEKELLNKKEQINKQIYNLINFISNDIAVDETSKKIKELENERNSIEKKLKDSKKNEQTNKISFNMIKSLSSTWNLMTFEEKRSIIDYLIKEIVIENNKVSIYYKIH